MFFSDQTQSGKLSLVWKLHTNSKLNRRDQRKETMMERRLETTLSGTAEGPWNLWCGEKTTGSSRIFLLKQLMGCRGKKQLKSGSLHRSQRGQARHRDGVVCCQWIRRLWGAMSAPLHPFRIQSNRWTTSHHECSKKSYRTNAFTFAPSGNATKTILQSDFF